MKEYTKDLNDNGADYYPRAADVSMVTCRVRWLQEQGALPRHTSAGFQNQLAIKIGYTAHLQRKSVSE